MSKFGFSRRRSAVAAVLVSMCIGAPVVWGAGPAAALSSGCAGANVTSHTNQEIGTLTFEAGDQVSVTAADPHDGGTPTTVLIQVNTATVATAAYPGTASYTFPTAGTVVLAEGVDSGNVDLTLTCVHPVTLPNAPAITSISAVSPDPAPVSVSVAFTSPDNGGGSDNPSYQVTCMTTDGHFAATAVGASSPIVVNGLAWGGSFECTVSATNEMGPGPSSPPYQFRHGRNRRLPGDPHRSHAGVVGTGQRVRDGELGARNVRSRRVHRRLPRDPVGRARTDARLRPGDDDGGHRAHERRHLHVLGRGRDRHLRRSLIVVDQPDRRRWSDRGHGGARAASEPACSRCASRPRTATAHPSRSTARRAGRGKAHDAPRRGRAAR